MAKKEEIQEAIIKDGKLYCKCGEPLGNGDDYFLVEYKGKNYIQFVKFCSGRICHFKSHYEVFITLEDRQLHVFPYEECKRFKDTKESKSDNNVQDNEE